MMQVRGKKQPVTVFEVMDHHDDASFPNLNETLQLYTQAPEYYCNKNWAAAMENFTAALRLTPKDELCAIYLNRCRHFQEKPPPADWNGVWVMQDK